MRRWPPHCYAATLPQSKGDGTIIPSLVALSAYRQYRLSLPLTGHDGVGRVPAAVCGTRAALTLNLMEKFMRNKTKSIIAALALLFTASSAFSAVNKPGAPQWVTATADGLIATVTFSPPVSNGGGTITKYTVSCNPSCIPSSGSASPIRVGGLIAGTAYTYTVTATNSAGTGVASDASNSAPVCDGGLGSSSVQGYVVLVNHASHHSIKIDGRNSGDCTIATGCDGFIDFQVATCSNGTGTVYGRTLNYGPSYDNTLVDAFYHVKHRKAQARFYMNTATGQITGIYAR